MKPTNILFTSINWRAGIVKRFVREFEKNREIRGKIVTVDTDRLAAGTYFSHKYYVVPYYKSDSYRGALYAILEKEEINIIILNTDRDCNYFKNFQEQLVPRGVRVFMPPGPSISIMNDKYETYKFFTGHGVLTPETYVRDAVPDDLTYPVIVKPRSDSGSNKVFVASSRKELDTFVEIVGDAVVQTFIKGQEYTVDILADFDGDIVGIVPRKRLGIKAGTSVKALTCYDERLIEASREICRLLRIRGVNCLQFIEEKSTGELYFIEANPRMGSGVLASIGAGFNLPYLIHRLNNGEKIALSDDFFKNNLYMLYYHEPIYLMAEDIHGESGFL